LRAGNSSSSNVINHPQLNSPSVQAGFGEGDHSTSDSLHRSQSTIFNPGDTPITNALSTSGDSMNPQLTPQAEGNASLADSLSIHGDIHRPHLIPHPEGHTSAAQAHSTAEDSMLDQRWPSGDDLLQILMSDASSWQIPLPVTEFFSPSAIENVDVAFSNDGSDTGSTGSGHRAVAQLGHLIKQLSSNLMNEIKSTGITSSFLDTCLHMFFSHFIPSFPMVHKPTFVIQDCSHPLLLNMIALGSLFVGDKSSVAKGETLWKLAHTTVATSWQGLMEQKGPKDECSGLQLVLTALLGQTYAILSENRKLRSTSQIFHGLGFYWARQCGMYDVEPFRLRVFPTITASNEEKTDGWQRWSASETQLRAVLGHYILDGQIAQFSGNATSAKHVSNPLPLPANEAAFEAKTAYAWILAMSKGERTNISFREIFLLLFDAPDYVPVKHLSILSIRVLLEGIQSIVSEYYEAEGRAVGMPPKCDIARALLRLYQNHISNMPLPTPEKLELLLRWHAICLNMAIDSSVLGRTLCKYYNLQQHVFSGERVSSRQIDLHACVESINGRRALLHAIAIQEIVENIPVGRAHAIHMPGAIFAAATIYSVRCYLDLSSIIVPPVIDWHDVWHLDRGSTRQSLSGSATESDTSLFLKDSYISPASAQSPRNLFFDLNTLQIILRAFSSRWGVSGEMERTLNFWMTAMGAPA
jgi:hypothetical protein